MGVVAPSPEVAPTAPANAPTVLPAADAPAPEASAAGISPGAAGGAGPPLPPLLSGVVAANTLIGRPLLQTPIGLVSLDGSQSLPEGAVVTLAPTGDVSRPDPAQPGAEKTAPSFAQGGGGGWKALSDAIEAVRQADPAQAQRLEAILPDLGPRFVPAMVAAVVAVQTGNPRALLGERAASALDKAGRGDLIEKLGADLEEMRAPVAMPSGGEWQALTLPLVVGAQIERIRLIVRRPAGDEDEAAERDEEGLRFLVDVDLSRLGPLQLDGLVKRRAKRFDLILRSRRALPDGLRADIAGAFARALDGMGMSGQAVFQHAVAFVRPLPLSGRQTGALTV